MEETDIVSISNQLPDLELCGVVPNSSGWNFRVIKNIPANGSFYYDIHEVYYDEGDIPNGMTINAVSLGGDDREEMLGSWGLYASAMTKPVLIYDEIKGFNGEEPSLALGVRIS